MGSGSNLHHLSDTTQGETDSGYLGVDTFGSIPVVSLAGDFALFVKSEVADSRQFPRLSAKAVAHHPLEKGGLFVAPGVGDIEGDILELFE